MEAGRRKETGPQDGKSSSLFLSAFGMSLWWMLALCRHLQSSSSRDTNGQKFLPKFDALVYVSLLLFFLPRFFYFLVSTNYNPFHTESVGLAPEDGKEIKKIRGGKRISVLRFRDQDRKLSTEGSTSELPLSF